MNKTTKFRGAGCNGPSLLNAITNSINSPSKETVPAGATWPFVTLLLEDNSVIFNMAHIQRATVPAKIKEVSLSRLGYIFFKTHDHKNEFGFATVRTMALLKELQERGYTLDESCQRNLFVAKVPMALSLLIPSVILATIIVMSILKPNGV